MLIKLARILVVSTAAFSIFALWTRKVPPVLCFSLFGGTFVLIACIELHEGITSYVSPKSSPIFPNSSEEYEVSRKTHPKSFWFLIIFYFLLGISIIGAAIFFHFYEAN